MVRNSSRKAVRIKSNVFDILALGGKFLIVCGHRENRAELDQSSI